MRLIDADAIIAEQYDILKKLYGGTAQTLKDHLDIDDDLSVPIHAMERYSRAKQFYYGLKGIEENAPTVDAVPVVRCKDCKWFADNNDGDWLGCWLFHTIRIIPEDAPKPDDFCSYGEPKMDGGAENAAD